MQEGERFGAERRTDAGADHEIEQFIASRGARMFGAEPELLCRLLKLAVVGAERIEARNVRRMIRALEVHHATGVPFSDWQRRDEPPFRPVLIAIDVEREQVRVLLEQYDKGTATMAQVESARAAEQGAWIQYYDALHTYELVRISVENATGTLLAAVK